MKKDKKIDFSYNHIIRGTPHKMVLLLHGYGSNKEDMTRIVHLLDAQNCVFIIPNAPYPCIKPEIEIPCTNGFYWFLLNDFNLIEISESVNQSAKDLCPFVESMMKTFNIPAERTVVSGFSQGGMMACQLGTIFKQNLAGVVSFSGSFSSLSIANEQINRDIYYTIIHGEDDSILPIHFGQRTSEELRKISVNVEHYFLPNTDHVISQEAIDIANRAIRKYLEQKL